MLVFKLLNKNYFVFLSNMDVKKKLHFFSESFKIFQFWYVLLFEKYPRYRSFTARRHLWHTVYRLAGWTATFLSSAENSHPRALACVALSLYIPMQVQGFAGNFSLLSFSHFVSLFRQRPYGSHVTSSHSYSILFSSLPSQDFTACLLIGFDELARMITSSWRASYYGGTQKIYIYIYTPVVWFLFLLLSQCVQTCIKNFGSWILKRKSKEFCLFIYLVCKNIYVNRWKITVSLIYN